MFLSELFTDSKVDYSWHKMGGVDVSVFEVGEYRYITQFIKMDSGHILYKMMQDKLGLTSNTYFIGFAAERDGEVTDRDTGSGNAVKVISVVMQCIEEFVNCERCDMLYFGCSKESSVRMRLYKKIMDRYCEKHQWNKVGETECEYMGDVKKVWVVSNKV